MTILISTYHIVATLVGSLTIFGIGFKILNLKLKESWKKDIDALKDSEDLKRKWISDFEKMLYGIEEKTYYRIDNRMDSKVQLFSKDMNQVQDALSDLKTILKTQQETLIAIQVSVADLKPRLDNLEKRVDKLENSN